MTGVHHVSVLTGEPVRLAGFLQDALGLAHLADLTVPRAAVAGLFGWGPGPDPVGSALYGRGACGLVEIVDCPDADRADLAPRQGQCRLAFVVPDVGACVEAAHRHGAEQVVGPRTVEFGRASVVIATCTVAGTRIQLTQGDAG